MLAVFPYRGEELGEIVETSGQLVGVTFIQPVFEGIVPWQCLVAVQCVPSRNADVVKARVLTQFACDVIEVFLRALSPSVIGFIERRDGYDLVSRFLEIACGDIHELCPMFRIAVIPWVDRRMVAVQHQFDIRLAKAQQAEPFGDGVFLFLLQVAVHERISGLERGSDDGYIVFSHESHAAA